jgi:hypothetical protein
VYARRPATNDMSVPVRRTARTAPACRQELAQSLVATPTYTPVRESLSRSVGTRRPRGPPTRPRAPGAAADRASSPRRRRCRRTRRRTGGSVMNATRRTRTTCRGRARPPGRSPRGPTARRARRSADGCPASSSRQYDVGSSAPPGNRHDSPTTAIGPAPGVRARWRARPGAAVGRRGHSSTRIMAASASTVGWSNATVAGSRSPVRPRTLRSSTASRLSMPSSCSGVVSADAGRPARPSRFATSAADGGAHEARGARRRATPPPAGRRPRRRRSRDGLRGRAPATAGSRAPPRRPARPGGPQPPPSPPSPGAPRPRRPPPRGARRTSRSTRSPPRAGRRTPAPGLGPGSTPAAAASAARPRAPTTPAAGA